MIKTRNAAERFALRAFAAARCAEEYEGPVFHEQSSFIPQTSVIRQAPSCQAPVEGSRNITYRPRNEIPRLRYAALGTIIIVSQRQDRHLPADPPDRSARCHRPAQKLCNRVQVPRFSRAKI